MYVFECLICTINDAVNMIIKFLFAPIYNVAIGDA